MCGLKNASVPRSGHQPWPGLVPSIVWPGLGTDVCDIVGLEVGVPLTMGATGQEQGVQGKERQLHGGKKWIVGVRWSGSGGQSKIIWGQMVRGSNGWGQ